jgi:hypothetical protein
MASASSGGSAAGVSTTEDSSKEGVLPSASGAVGGGVLPSATSSGGGGGPAYIMPPTCWDPHSWPTVASFGPRLGTLSSVKAFPARYASLAKKVLPGDSLLSEEALAFARGSYPDGWRWCKRMLSLGDIEVDVPHPIAVDSTSGHTLLADGTAGGLPVVRVLDALGGSPGLIPSTVLDHDLLIAVARLSDCPKLRTAMGWLERARGPKGSWGMCAGATWRVASLAVDAPRGLLYAVTVLCDPMGLGMQAEGKGALAMHVLTLLRIPLARPADKAIIFQRYLYQAAEKAPAQGKYEPHGMGALGAEEELWELHLGFGEVGVHSGTGEVFLALAGHPCPPTPAGEACQPACCTLLQTPPQPHSPPLTGTPMPPLPASCWSTPGCTVPLQTPASPP